MDRLYSTRPPDQRAMQAGSICRAPAGNTSIYPVGAPKKCNWLSGDRAQSHRAGPRGALHRLSHHAVRRYNYPPQPSAPRALCRQAWGNSCKQAFVNLRVPQLQIAATPPGSPLAIHRARTCRELEHSTFGLRIIEHIVGHDRNFIGIAETFCFHQQDQLLVVRGQFAQMLFYRAEIVVAPGGFEFRPGETKQHTAQRRGGIKIDVQAFEIRRLVVLLFVHCRIMARVPFDCARRQRRDGGRSRHPFSSLHQHRTQPHAQADEHNK